MKDRLNGDRPKVRVELQPNGTAVVKARTDSDVRAALMAGMNFTLEVNDRRDEVFGLKVNQNGTVTAVARNDREVRAAMTSGHNYSLS